MKLDLLQASLRSGLVNSEPENGGRCDACARKEGMSAAIVSGVNYTPVLEPADVSSIL